MTAIGQIDKLFSIIAPKSLSESWDNDGVMLCGNLEKTVKKALFALEVRKQTAEYARDNGFDLIVTHHPFIFRGISHITPEKYGVLEILIKSGISVLSYHTRLDSAQGGVNDVLAQKLGLSEVRCFGGESGQIGRIGKVNGNDGLSLNEFAKSVKQKLGCENIMVSCADTGKVIRIAAVVGGAGKDFMSEAKSAGADAFVTSEIPHHMFIAVQETDLCVLDCGHYYTENPVAYMLENAVKQKFPEIYTEVFDVKSPYFCV